MKFLRGFSLLRSALIDLMRDESLRRTLQQRHNGLKLGKHVEIRSPERLKLGDQVTIDSGVLLHCGGMDWSAGQGEIVIGDRSYIGPHCVLFGAGGIRIGKSVLISPGVVFASHQHTFARSDVPMQEQPNQFAAIVIDDNVWIGSNATILPGVSIGAGSIVGAGAVVTRDVAAGQMVLGVPARPVRQVI